MRKLLRSTIFLILVIIFAQQVTASGVDFTRSTIDRTDDFPGYQIHVFYVVPADGEDEKRDINGEIETTIRDAQRWLDLKAGHRLLIDTFQGKVDVTFLKSKYKIGELCESTCDALKKLASEAKKQDPQISSGKTFYFQISGILDQNYCGWAFGSSNLALGFHSKEKCNSQNSVQSRGVSDPAGTFIHEIFHTYGVEHVCQDRNDLMVGTPQCAMELITSGNYLINLDKSHKNYIGGDGSGSDVLKMPVWDDKSGLSSYEERVSKSGDKYFPQREDGQVFAVVGKESGNFNWTWNKVVDIERADVSCLMTSGRKVIEGKSEKGGCKFIVPNNWSVGDKFNVDMKFNLGPYFGSASAEGLLARADYTTTQCSPNYCVLGGSISIESCWSPNVKRVIVQELKSGKWVTLQNSRVNRTNKNCNFDKKYPLSASARINFDQVGNHYLRWYIPGSTSTSEFKDKPFAVIVKEVGGVEPTKAEIASANSLAVSLGKTADRKR